MASDKPTVPQHISWSAPEPDKFKKVRAAGADVMTRSDQFGLAMQMGKNAHNEAFNLSADITGNAIDINFGPMGKYNAPIMANSELKEKPQEPIIQVSAAQDEAQQQLKPNDTGAPLYDGFQPHYAHYSDSMEPAALKSCVTAILEQLVVSGSIDYYEKSPYVFNGRCYARSEDCEWMLSIFSDQQKKSVLELRRSGGEVFTYANCESLILDHLQQRNAIEDEMSNDDDDESESAASFALGSFGFGIDALPTLDSMALDSDDEEKAIPLIDESIDAQKALDIVQNAVNKNSMRDEWRSDVSYLTESMAKNEEVYKQVPDVIATIATAITDDLFDCWIIKSYLAMISKLISCDAKVPSNLEITIEHISTRWSKAVVNEVTPGVNFEFAPSQQIVRCCAQIQEQLK